MATSTTPSPSEMQYEQEHMDDNRGPILIAVSVVFIIGPTIAVSLRWAARLQKRVPIGIDEILALITLIFVILLCVENFLSQLFLAPLLSPLEGTPY
jgi:hypothetical protein